MIIQPWVELLARCKMITLPQGTSLFHGARRLDGEDWIQDVMWVTISKDDASEYVRRDASQMLKRKLLEFRTLKDLILLDWSSLSGPKLSDLAQQEYGADIVGTYDYPIRRHLLETARNAKQCEFDGCIKWEGQEILIDRIPKILREV